MFVVTLVVHAFPSFLVAVPGVTVSGTATNSTYVTNLIGWWSMDETSGTRASWTNNLTLTDNNSCSYTNALVTNSATIFHTASQYFSRASEDNLRLASNCTFVCWVRLNNDAADRHILSKGSGNSAANYEYWLYYDSATDDFFWQVSDGSAAKSATTASTYLAGTFYFVACGLSNSIAWVSVDGGTRAVASAGNTNAGGTATFRVGSNPANTGYFNGSVDELAFWKNRVLTDAELTHLRNSGSGRPFPGN